MSWTEWRIKPLTADLAPICQSGFGAMGWTKPNGYFADCVAKMTAGEMEVLVALNGSEYLGHVRVIWESDYTAFREQEIPEVNDLNVVPAMRRRGLGTELIVHAEEIIRTRSKRIGISVGLHPGYNAARRLYVKLGYIPDGRGVTWKGQYIEEGAQVVADDELLIHLVKA